MMLRTVIVLLATWMMFACVQVTDDGSEDESTNEPLVLSLTPAIDATDQALNSVVVVQFDTAMNPATITTDSVTLTPAVTGTLTFSSDNTTVTFTPEAPLTAGTTYTVSLAETITDADGNAITAKTFSFTTDSWQGIIQNGVSGATTKTTAMAFDADGDLWVAGNTDGDLDGETSSANVDIFLSEYSPLGALLRTELIGGAGNSFVSDIEFDSDGNLYVLGETSGDINGETATGTKDSLLIKYNSDMVRQWTSLIGFASSETSGVSLTLSSTGIPYILGTTTGNIGAVLAGTQDLFYAKVVIDDFNTSITKKQTGAVGGTLYAGGIVVDGSNIYISGSTNVSLDSQTQLGDRDGFITKLDSDLNKVTNSTVQYGAAGLSIDPYKLLLDRDGYLLPVGLIAGAGTLNSQVITLHETTFLIQYDTSLSYRATAVYGESNEYSGAVDATLDSDGNIYVTGYTNTALDDNTASGMKDAFIIKFTPIFQKLWVSQTGAATGNTDGFAVAVDADGNSFIAGDTTAVLTGEAAIGTTDYFIAKFNSDGVLQ